MENSKEIAENIIYKYAESECYQGEVYSESAYPYTQIEKAVRIAYLRGIVTYSILADHVPNGDDKYETFKKELNELTNEK